MRRTRRAWRRRQGLWDACGMRGGPSGRFGLVRGDWEGGRVGCGGEVGAVFLFFFFCC